MFVFAKRESKEEHVARKQQKIQIKADFFGDMGIHDLLCVRIRPTCQDPDLSNLLDPGSARPAQLSVSALTSQQIYGTINGACAFGTGSTHLWKQHVSGGWRIKQKHERTGRPCR